MAVAKQDQRIVSLYGALKKKNKYVARLCGDLPPEDPLLRLNGACGDTFLHMAIRFRQLDLVDMLLEKLTEYRYDDSLSTIKNDNGDTILHELATADDMVDAATKVVGKDPTLLIALNNLGETPIFGAVRHGQISMLRFLGGQLEEQYSDDVKKQLQRDDKTTVLHIAITTEHFELACYIAERHSYLIAEKDEDEMTALQYLACNQRAFVMKKKRGEGFLEDRGLGWKMVKDRTFKDRVIESVYESSEHYRCHQLQSLVRILVQEDTAWMAEFETIHSSKAKKLEHRTMESNIKLFEERKLEEWDEKNFSKKEGNKVGTTEKRKLEFKKSDESPLYLAVMSNISEIIEEIFMQHTNVFEYTNKEGMNILQVAILHGNIEIFELVINSKAFSKSLLSSIDHEGNSLLHMVGQGRKGQARERMQNPAMQLRKECMFFQKVKAACNMHLIKPLNDHHQTAEELFAAKNEELHQEAKEWVMRTTENCTILSVFIATVAFAAAYTVPGGPNQNTGIPILNSKPWFVVFIMADIISLTLALTSVGIFLSILTSSFPLQDFENYLFKKLRRGIVSMVLSVSMMAVAFGATIVLAMTNNWENVAWIVVAFLPVPIFFLSYSPLRSAVLGPCPELFATIAVKFLICVIAFLSIFVILLPHATFLGLRWTAKKASKFIKHKLDRWNCARKSNTQSSHAPQV